MLDPRWLIALALIDLWALWWGQALLALTASFGLSIAAVIAASRKYCLVGVRYKRTLAHHRTQCGESIELTVELENRKLMPLALLELEDQLPRHVRVRGAIVRAARFELLPSLYLARPMLPYERVTQRVLVDCKRRGVHVFGPARWRSGDPFAPPSRHHYGSDTDPLLVLPKVFPVALDELTSRLLLGPHTSRQRLMSDPIRAVGARQYVSGDPLRAIDWRATGRRGALMVRELEPSTAPAIQIVLDFRIHQPSGDWIEPDELEFAISVAASIATYGARRGWRLGLRGNSRTTGGAPLAIPASRSPRQLHAVLEALARAGSRPNGSLVDLLCACEHEQRETAAWLVISSQIDERAQALLERMHSRGQTVLVLAITAREQRSEFGRLPVRYVSYDAGWMNRGALAFYA